MDIRPIITSDIDEAIGVIAASVFSVYGSGEPTPQRLEAVRGRLLSSGSLNDMRDIVGNYESAGGLFLVVSDSGKIVGTGAVKRLDDRTAELGRLWFLPGYRGRGWGRQMVERLIGFATSHGYESVRLDTSERCTDAVKLFRRFGFADIERYKDGPTTLFMELRLAGIGG